MISQRRPLLVPGVGRRLRVAACHVDQLDDERALLGGEVIQADDTGRTPTTCCATATTFGVGQGAGCLGCLQSTKPLPAPLGGSVPVQ